MFLLRLFLIFSLLITFLPLSAQVRPLYEAQNLRENLFKIIEAKKGHFIEWQENKVTLPKMTGMDGRTRRLVDSKLYADIYYLEEISYFKSEETAIRNFQIWIAQIAMQLPEFSDKIPITKGAEFQLKSFYSTGGDEPVMLNLYVFKEENTWQLMLEVGTPSLYNLQDIARVEGKPKPLYTEPSAYISKPLQPFQPLKEGTFDGKRRAEWGGIKWKNGDRYEGAVHSGEPTYGIYYFANGDTFNGKVVYGEKRGYRTGTYYWKDGSRYSYVFDGNGLPSDSKGVYMTREARWEGPFENGQLHGQAKEIRRYTKDTLSSIFKGGRKEGLYDVKTKDNVTYSWYENDVAVKKDIPMPKGFFYCLSGNCENGQGVGILSNGYRYEGGFKNYMLHGQGSARLADSSTYTGGWEKGKYHGFGKLVYADSSSWYEGNWEDGKYSGSGKQFTKMEYLDGRSSIYEGSFERGMRVGQGTLTMSDGTVITGEFNGRIWVGTETTPKYIYTYSGGRLMWKQRVGSDKKEYVPH